ncbi:DUF2062 domain-containing protein [Halovenus sp. WSH3]|uniref:DUF2062 domain-containing protein n=1 Tax=Halovenus carboxidivorans TaxID=2692199 RepID=A0A6B0T5X5_9EURY|nr:DUF2062 domain-containing protein [Halovenus carboxidivorans]MXR50280.1 DUF2062 domain-containing protein [Halovenus carboxidivorans]
MVRQRVNEVLAEVKDRLIEAFVEDHTSQEVAFSFSLGVFITALPSLGTGLLVFVVLAYLFDRLSKIALFASVVVLNPVVKWGVYGASYSLGRFILGPAPGVTFTNADVSLSAGPDLLVRLWLGNLILATLFAIIGYLLALRIVNEFRRRVRSDDHPQVGFPTETTPSEE